MDAVTGESGESLSETSPTVDPVPKLPTPQLYANTGPDSAAPAAHAGARTNTQRTYRSEQARSKSVYRRANPWWRRVLRAMIGVCLLGAAGVVVYFGVGLVQDFLGRDRLPTAGAEVPNIGSASFQITSESPSPTIDGTLSIDFQSSAFEFVGSPTGTQAGLQVVSPDGTNMFVRTTDTDWRPASPNDGIVQAIQTSVPFLSSVSGPDDVLENRLRQGNIELVDQVNVGVDEDELRTYEMTLDTNDYEANWPLQWERYQSEVVPAIGVGDAVPVVMTLDADNVVVRFSAPESNWAWERLTYSEFGMSITDPARE